MTTNVPDDRDLDTLVGGLPPDERDWLWWAVEKGVAVRNREHAALAVAYARRRKRDALRRDLPLYAGSTLLAGVIGWMVTGRSEAFGFLVIVGGALFVGWAWWAETYRPRHRAMLANLSLLQGGEPDDGSAAERSGGTEWGMAFPLAWATSMAVGGVLHFGLDAPGWIGMPLFFVALFLFRRLIGRTVESIDEWGRR